MRPLTMTLVVLILSGCGGAEHGSAETESVTAGAVGVESTIGGATATESEAGTTIPTVGGSMASSETAAPLGAGGTTATGTTSDRSGVGGASVVATTVQLAAGGTTAATSTTCADIARTSETCSEAVSYGFCAQTWFVGYCSISCKKCGTTTGAGGATSKPTTTIGGSAGVGGATAVGGATGGATTLQCCLRTSSGTYYATATGNPATCTTIGSGWIPIGPAC